MQCFQIGEMVYFVKLGSREYWIPCPDCFGKRALTVIMGDGSEVSIACAGCDAGLFEPPRGVVKRYQATATVAVGPVYEITSKGGKIAYAVGYSSGYWHPDDIFATAEEAGLALEAAVKTQQDQEQANFDRREKPTRTWSWNAHYHRARIRDAEKELAYHKSKLAVAKAKAKEPEAATT